MIDKIRQEGQAVLLVNVGDFSLAPDPLGELKSDILAKAMAAMKYDAVVPGERDLAMGNQFIESLSGRLPLLSCNLEFEGEEVGIPSLIVDRGGLKIGLIGVTLPTGDGMMAPGWVMADPDERVEKLTMELKDKVDLLVGLFHVGFDEGRKLAEKYQNLDVVILGHGGTRIYDPILVGGTVVLKGETHGRSLGRLDLGLGDSPVEQKSAELIPLGSDIEDQSGMLPFLDEYRTRRKAQLRRIYDAE